MGETGTKSAAATEAPAAAAGAAAANSEARCSKDLPKEHREEQRDKSPRPGRAAKAVAKQSDDELLGPRPRRIDKLDVIDSKDV